MKEKGKKNDIKQVDCGGVKTFKMPKPTELKKKSKKSK